MEYDEEQLINLDIRLNKLYLPFNKKIDDLIAMINIHPEQEIQKNELDESTNLNPRNINEVYVLDVSYSMYGKKIDAVKKYLFNRVSTLADEDYISIITFSDDVKVILPPKKVKDIKNKIQNIISQVNVENSTMMFSALEFILKKATEYNKKSYANRLVLLSDGNPTDLKKLKEYETIAKRLREMGFIIDTIGFGDDYNYQLMNNLAKVTAGQWIHYKDEAVDDFTNDSQERETVYLPHSDLIIKEEQGVFLKEAYMRYPQAGIIKLVYQADGTIKIPLGFISLESPIRVITYWELDPVSPPDDDDEDEDEDEDELIKDLFTVTLSCEDIKIKKTVRGSFTSDDDLVQEEQNLEIRETAEVTRVLSVLRDAGDDEKKIKEAQNMAKTMAELGIGDHAFNGDKEIISTIMELDIDNIDDRWDEINKTTRHEIADEEDLDS